MLDKLLRRIRGEKSEAPPVSVGSHDDRLAQAPAMHVDPDDEGRTREDREAEKASRRPPPGSVG
jgi:hypothetical protein